MTMNLNFVDLVEKNPIVSLTNTYNNILLEKIKKSFTDEEQKLFISSFFCYLNYDKQKDFVIDLDTIWEWVGFKRKSNAKELLEKIFIKDTDYVSSVPNKVEKNQKYGGNNHIQILMTIKTFKSLCLKAGTKKASEIHEYYLKMEDVLYETLDEESQDLKQQLQFSYAKSKEESLKAAEKATIAQFPLNTECIYISSIDNKTPENESLIKFGQTNNLETRTWQHRGTFENFTILEAFRVQNKVEIENIIRSHPKIKPFIRKIEVKGKMYKEMIAVDNKNFTVEKLVRVIKGIITERQYTIDNFNEMVKKHDALNAKCDILTEKFQESQEDIRELQEEARELTLKNKKLTIENKKLKGNEVEIQEKIEKIVENYEPNKEIAKKTEKNPKTAENFQDWMFENCIISGDAEVSGADIVGRFRITTRNEKREVTASFRDYLNNRFKQGRLKIQDKNAVVNGYFGIKLKEIDTPFLEEVQEEHKIFKKFLEETCTFSPSGKEHYSQLIEEFKNWNTFDNTLDAKEIVVFGKTLKCLYGETVWANGSSGQGFYGLTLTKNIKNARVTSSTGKKVEKRCGKTHEVLETFDTIAKAAVAEGMSPAKMSRSVKNKTVFNISGSSVYYSV
jgi:hypothetical protein